MRIGFLTYGMDGHLTGIGRYAQELTYALREVQPGTEIILLNPYPASPLAWYRDFPTHAIPSLKILPSVVTYGSMLLERAARSLDLDVLHDPAGIAPFLAPRSRTRRVVTVHDAIPYIHPEVQPLLTRLVFRTLVPAARWTADAVVTGSESARNDLIRHAGLRQERTHVTRYGGSVPSEGEIEGWRKRVGEMRDRYGITGRYFLSVGHVARRKNLPRLLEALASVRRAYPDAQLLIVGPEAWWAHETLAPARAMGDAVRVTGFVDDDTLHVLYAGATALVYPSLYEGFGLPPLEAMAHGTPVIASNTSSLPEVVGDAGILVDPTDVPAIAAAMERVAGDEKLREALRRAGRERAREFTWHKTAQATLGVYERILGARTEA